MNLEKTLVMTHREVEEMIRRCKERERSHHAPLGRVGHGQLLETCSAKRHFSRVWAQLHQLVPILPGTPEYAERKSMLLTNTCSVSTLEFYGNTVAGTDSKG